MYRHGLVLAGLVAGMAVFGGSAFAATTGFPKDHDDNRKILFVCGDDNYIAGGDINKNENKLLNIETGDILGILSAHSEDDNRKCTLA
ncbi:hypothetical protein ACFPOI_02185 [Nonomuraea angiospora]|uniref:Uncharacterized protein n=1 Tax=Nonomuraea angiospora TaxID=46172 RepID=A0ABR9M3P5_9ACTN|nr:hypothetical protein [Nonomuraea angiospora]MBE1587215.1 hypothetical protein [Nonomuraea angiospora]